MESASYMESNNDTSLLNEDENLNSSNDLNHEEEYTPQLFSNNNDFDTVAELEGATDTNTEKLFDQDSNEEEDFEIPAFLRKQKF